MKILNDVPISTLTTMRLGGPAKYVAVVATPDDVDSAYQYAHDNNLSVTVIGEGSNLIGRDEGYDGLIIQNQLKGIEITNQDDFGATIVANSGEVLDNLIAFSVDKGLHGIEMLTAIPGTVGAAPVQNSGAYGAEIGDTIQSVDVYEIATGEFKTLPKSELNLSYRHSIFNSEAVGQYFIIAITIKLNKQPPEPPFYKSLQEYLDQHNITDYSINTIREAVREIRASKLPDPKEIASSGSFFKNVIFTESEAADFTTKYPNAPIFQQNGQHKLATAWLLDQAGLKGQTFHGMTVNEQAPLVLMNTGAKSFADLESAKAEIIDIIHQKFDITIEAEPQIIK